MTKEFKGRVKKAIFYVIGSGSVDGPGLELLVEQKLGIGVSTLELAEVLNELLDEHFIRVSSVSPTPKEPHSLVPTFLVTM